MKGIHNNPFRTAAYYLSVGVLAASTLAFAQDPNVPSTDQSTAASNGGWKRVGDAPAAADQAPPANDANNVSQNTGYPAIQQPSDPNQQPLNQPPPPGYGPANNGQAAPPQGSYGQPGPAQGGYPQGGYGQGTYGSYQQPPAPQPVPAQLTIPAGTYITVRVNQLLSSDKNQVGDAFSASLVQPIVVNGVVVAEPGQTVAGRVAEAKKAGHIEGVARLGLQLTTLTLVDGQQLPIQTQLISRSGPTSVGQDAGTIVGTTALGAAAGAVADWGRGAAIGAGAGAAVGIIGVLVTRGHPSIITPEQVLTFRLEAPLTVSTTNAPQAFRYVQPNEYDRPYGNGGYPGGGYGAGYGEYAAAAPPPYYYGYPYPYYYAGYPYYWWPGFGFYWGPSFYFRGYYGGRFYGGRYYGPVGRAGVAVGGRVSGGAVGHAAGGGGGHR
jgi:hypothetical protein